MEVGRLLRIALIVIVVALAWAQLHTPSIVEPPKVQLEEVTVELGYRDSNGHRISEGTYRIQMGYEHAQESRISSHADCEQLGNHLEVTGCHRYVTEHKEFPPHVRQGNWDSGKTTAQCREEVSAYWDAVIQEIAETSKIQSDPFSGAPAEKVAELRECQNYDNLRGVQPEGSREPMTN